MDYLEIEDVYFTREEINELMEDINDKLREEDLNGCLIIGIYMEGKTLEMDIADDYGYEKTIKEKIDMRKAPNFNKLEEKYMDSLTQEIIDTYNRENDYERL